MWRVLNASSEKAEFVILFKFEDNPGFCYLVSKVEKLEALRANGLHGTITSGIFTFQQQIFFPG